MVCFFSSVCACKSVFALTLGWFVCISHLFIHCVILVCLSILSWIPVLLLFVCQPAWLLLIWMKTRLRRLFWPLGLFILDAHHAASVTFWWATVLGFRSYVCLFVICPCNMASCFHTRQMNSTLFRHTEEGVKAQWGEWMWWTREWILSSGASMLGNMSGSCVALHKKKQQYFFQPTYYVTCISVAQSTACSKPFTTLVTFTHSFIHSFVHRWQQGSVSCPRTLRHATGGAGDLKQLPSSY